MMAGLTRHRPAMPIGHTRDELSACVRRGAALGRKTPRTMTSTDSDRHPPPGRGAARCQIGQQTGDYRASSFSPSGRSSPDGETCRYRVWRAMPSSAHRSLTLVPGWPMEAMASRSFAGVIL